MWNNKTLKHMLAVAMFMMIMFSGPSVMADQETTLVCDIWCPYEFETEDGVTGMSVEIIEAVYKRMGVTQLKIKALPWRRAIDSIRFDEADALFSASKTPERKSFLRYPDEPIFTSSWIIWTKNDSSLKTLNDLKGKTIGVVLGFSYTQEFWEFIRTYCSVEEVHTDHNNFKKLSLGRLDALVAEYGNGLNLVRTLGDKDIKPVPCIEIKRSGLYIAFNRHHTNEEFVKQFSNELKLFKQTDEHRAIREKYLDNDKCR